MTLDQILDGLTAEIERTRTPSPHPYKAAEYIRMLERYRRLLGAQDEDSGGIGLQE